MRAILKLTIEETDDSGTTTTLPLAFGMYDDMGYPVADVYDALKGDHRRLRFATWLLPSITEAIVQANYAADTDPEEGVA